MSVEDALFNKLNIIVVAAAIHQDKRAFLFPLTC